MKPTSFSTEKKSFGSFFPVMMACMFQGQTYKWQPTAFLSELLSIVIVTGCFLILLAMAMPTLLLPEPISLVKIEKLRSQQFGVSYSKLAELYLGLILIFSCFQYLAHRKETELNWWYFLLSTTVAVSLGFLARWFSTFLLNRRINAFKPTETITHS